jgi:hypothetical protein
MHLVMGFSQFVPERNVVGRNRSYKKNISRHIFLGQPTC